MRSSRIKIDPAEHTAVYHCISRCVRGEWLLDEQAKEVLRKQIWQVADFCGVEVLTYCIMSNHFHILVKVNELEAVSDEELVRRLYVLYGSKSGVRAEYERRLSLENSLAEETRNELQGRMGDISFYMKELKQRFTRWYNKSHGTFGTVWAERFKSVMVEPSAQAMKTMATYIDLNPIRAGIVEDPKDYRWCGYAEAVAGHQQARNGLKTVCDRVRWDGAQNDYRALLYLVGQEDAAVHRGKKVAGSNNSSTRNSCSGPRKREFDRKQVIKVLNKGGRLSMAEVLRCRVRYFSDGAVLGSQAFVEDWFREKKEKSRHAEKPLFVNRKSGWRKMSGSDWQGLTIFRDLRREIFA